MTFVIRIHTFRTDGPLRHNRAGPHSLDDTAISCSPRREVIVSVVVILLMFLAVIAMVEKVDRDRLRHPILVPESRGAEDTNKLQTKE